MTLIKNLMVGDDFVGFYLVRELEVKQTNASPPKDYFDIVLSDASGQMPAKYWEVSTTDKETVKPLVLVKVQGQVISYREKPQIKIQRIRKAAAEDDVTLSDFILTAPIPSHQLVTTLKEAVQSISDTRIREIVQFCFLKVESRLLDAPAAKSHHHAYYGGLAYHITRMLELGEFVCRQRPFLNPDLIKAGILLHDIAKPSEMDSTLGIVTDYSVQGKLIGHISMVSSWITEAAIHLGIELSAEVVTVLQHLVLAHHNLGEWGSPVQPQIAEAVALHFIDQLDAKLQMVEDAVSGLGEHDRWTSAIRALENKSIYRPLTLE